MNLKPKEIYLKFNKEDIEVKIPKYLLFDLMRQVKGIMIYCI